MDADIDDTSSLDASALVSNRDGIAGTFKHVPDEAKNRHPERTDNLWLWSSERRAQIFDFEVMSRIGFSVDDTKTVFLVRHLSLDATATPPIAYKPMVQLKRPSDGTYRAQTAIVAAYADLRDDRKDEILAQLDGNETFFASILSLHPERHRWTYEVLDLVARTAEVVSMRCKHALAALRPSEYSAQIQPMIQVPGHASTPSGHSTAAFATAIVLFNLTKSRPVYSTESSLVQLLRQAARIAINRQVAGLHFPVDTAAGAVLGMTLGSYLVQRLIPTPGYNAWCFDGDAYDSDADFKWLDYYDTKPGYDGRPIGQKKVDNQKAGRPVVFPISDDNPVMRDEQSPILNWLWKRASKEWI